MLCSAPRERVFLSLRRVGDQAVIRRLEFRAGKAAPARKRACLRAAFLHRSVSIGCLQNPVLFARLGADLGKGTDRRLRHDMRRKVLFHPDHVVPAVEFVPALPEFPDEAIPQVRVELFRIVRQIFVARAVRAGDARFHIANALQSEYLRQCVVQLAAEAHLLASSVHINARLDRPIIGCAFLERAGIGIAQEFPVPFRDEVGVFLQRMA